VLWRIRPTRSTSSSSRTKLGELYLLERSRNAELDDRIEELKTAIRRHLAADHNDGSADDLRDALKGTADD
jgi:hypothetical protein